MQNGLHGMLGALSAEYDAAHSNNDGDSALECCWRILMDDSFNIDDFVARLGQQFPQFAADLAFDKHRDSVYAASTVMGKLLKLSPEVFLLEEDECQSLIVFINSLAELGSNSIGARQYINKVLSSYGHLIDQIQRFRCAYKDHRVYEARGTILKMANYAKDQLAARREAIGWLRHLLDAMRCFEGVTRANTASALAEVNKDLIRTISYGTAANVAVPAAAAVAFYILDLSPPFVRLPVQSSSANFCGLRRVIAEAETHIALTDLGKENSHFKAISNEILCASAVLTACRQFAHWGRHQALSGGLCHRDSRGVSDYAKVVAAEERNFFHKLASTACLAPRKPLGFICSGEFIHLNVGDRLGFLHFSCASVTIILSDPLSNFSLALYVDERYSRLDEILENAVYELRRRVLAECCEAKLRVLISDLKCVESVELDLRTECESLEEYYTLEVLGRELASANAQSAGSLDGNTAADILQGSQTLTNQTPEGNAELQRKCNNIQQERHRLLCELIYMSDAQKRIAGDIATLCEELALLLRERRMQVRIFGLHLLFESQHSFADQMSKVAGFESCAAPQWLKGSAKVLKDRYQQSLRMASELQEAITKLNLHVVGGKIGYGADAGCDDCLTMPSEDAQDEAAAPLLEPSVTHDCHLPREDAQDEAAAPLLEPSFTHDCHYWCSERGFVATCLPGEVRVRNLAFWRREGFQYSISRVALADGVAYCASYNDPELMRGPESVVEVRGELKDAPVRMSRDAVKGWNRLMDSEIPFSIRSHLFNHKALKNPRFSVSGGSTMFSDQCFTAVNVFALSCAVFDSMSTLFKQGIYDCLNLIKGVGFKGEHEIISTVLSHIKLEFVWVSGAYEEQYTALCGALKMAINSVVAEVKDRNNHSAIAHAIIEKLDASFAVKTLAANEKQTVEQTTLEVTKEFEGVKQRVRFLLQTVSLQSPIMCLAEETHVAMM